MLSAITIIGITTLSFVVIVVLFDMYRSVEGRLELEKKHHSKTKVILENRIEELERGLTIKDNQIQDMSKELMSYKRKANDSQVLMGSYREQQELTKDLVRQLQRSSTVIVDFCVRDALRKLSEQDQGFDADTIWYKVSESDPYLVTIGSHQTSISNSISVSDNIEDEIIECIKFVRNREDS